MKRNEKNSAPFLSILCYIPESSHQLDYCLVLPKLVEIVKYDEPCGVDQREPSSEASGGVWRGNLEGDK
jgi:hypothetical protein